MSARRSTRAVTLRRVLLPAAAALFAALCPAVAQEADDDPVLRAISDEIDRAMTLHMEGLERPYWAAAYVNDEETFSAAATFGALTSRGGGRNASVSVSMRVGTADLDNTNFSSFSFSGFGGVATPSEPNYDALRQTLWLDFDGEYKGAAEAINKKRAYLKSNTVKERLPDFGEAPVVNVILPIEKMDVDKEKWIATVKNVSAVFREYDFVHTCDVRINATFAHQYFVSTDPVKHRFPFPYCEVTMQASTQCEDGMRVTSRYKKMARTPADLPSAEELTKVAHEVAKRLDELRTAPTAKDYWGPVLFTGEAAATFFLKTVADPLSDVRQDLGRSSGGRLVDRMNRRIASKLITVRDDPTLKEWNGEPLLGYFPVDDDGVLPVPITLVDKGFLRTHYMSRVPTKHEKKTNGHSRAGKGSAGTLIVAAGTSSMADMEKKLVELAKDEDLPYGLMVERFAGGFGFSFGGGTTVRLPRPGRVYRIYPDGRRQIVRGAAFQQASFRVLRDVVALGDTLQVVNTRQSGQLASVIAPAVLATDLELRRPREEFSKPPYSGRPDMSAK